MEKNNKKDDVSTANKGILFALELLISASVILRDNGAGRQANKNLNTAIAHIDFHITHTIGEEMVKKLKLTPVNILTVREEMREWWKANGYGVESSYESFQPFSLKPTKQQTLKDT